jgi:hypothetical protein
LPGLDDGVAASAVPMRLLVRPAHAQFDLGLRFADVTINSLGTGGYAQRVEGKQGLGA